MRETKEEIKIGSRVKIREGCFNSLSLKGKVGIVVDDAGNDDVTVLFPGWNEGHDGVPFSKSERKFGNKYNTCYYIPLGMLQAVHDGFEIGDTVEYETADGYKTGTVVDFNIFNGFCLYTVRRDNCYNDSEGAESRDRFFVKCRICKICKIRSGGFAEASPFLLFFAIRYF